MSIGSIGKQLLPVQLEQSVARAIHAVATDSGEQAVHLGTALQRAIAHDPINEIGLRTAVFNAAIEATSFRSSPMQAKVAMHELVAKLGDRFDNSNLAAALHAHVPK